VSVYAVATPGGGDLQVMLRYGDGSTATIGYTSSGSPRFGKETLDLTADGQVLRFDDFKRAAVHGPKGWTSGRLPQGQDKGQRDQVAAFVDAVRSGGPMPIRLASLLTTSRATLAVPRSLATGLPVLVDRGTG
jgi:predicted dehydrogenase